MNDRMRIETLLAELDADVAGLDELIEANARAVERVRNGAGDDLDWAALGYTIHNIYNAFESYFLRVSKFFENDLSAATWHRDLVDRMSLEIEGVRPRLLDRSLARDIHELRAFRHVFRNIYGNRLDPERTRIVQARVPESVEAFRAAHAEFTRAMRDLADLLDP